MPAWLLWLFAVLAILAIIPALEFVRAYRVGPRLTVNVDEVQFTVYTPQVVRDETWYTLLAYAHRRRLPPFAPVNSPTPQEVVASDAQARLGVAMGHYEAAVNNAIRPIPQGDQLSFHPKVKGLEFNPPHRTFHWKEDVHCEEFRFRVSARHEGKTLYGTMLCMLGNILVAEINLAIRVSSDAGLPGRGSPTEALTASRYRNIFASYSHKDEQIVKEFERYAAATGDRYIRDCIDLRSGEVWNERLLELIDAADIFQLFWSENSCQSSFVEQEWRHAWEHGKRLQIRPVYWEMPLPPKNSNVPDPLNRLHFAYIGDSSARRAATWPIAIQALPLIVLTGMLGIWSFAFYRLYDARYLSEKVGGVETQILAGPSEPDWGVEIASPRDGQIISTNKLNVVLQFHERRRDVGPMYEFWIIERRGVFIWPKLPTIPVDTSEIWNGEIYLEGVDGPFALELRLVGTEGQETIREWIQKSENGQAVAPLQDDELRESMTIDNVVNLMLNL